MKHFATGLILRTLLLTLTAVATGYVVAEASASQWLWTLLGIVALVWQASSFYTYITSVNRKLTRFLESVQYSDFSVTFKSDNALGPSFRGLNQQFNDVLEAFRQARAEKETNLHYLNTIVQHVSVGLLAFDAAGTIELVNQTALRLLGTYRLRQLQELESAHPQLVLLLQETQTNRPMVYQDASNQAQLSVRCTSVRLRGRLVTLVSLQNIQSELQQKELEAWQNLTKILRHEIMNSITPIVSLVGTMQQIIDEDLEDTLARAEPVNDLREALMTIESRGRGIMRFVDAYRHFTSIPPPRLGDVSVYRLLKTVVALVQPELQQRQIGLQTNWPEQELMIQIDAGQIEMVLLNLLKNAMESLASQPDALIQIDTQTAEGRVIIRISDNGSGIEPEALEKIFIPFFTTKKTGSGIGLSLSRQIMQLHRGQLTAESSVGRGSQFSVLFV